MSLDNKNTDPSLRNAVEVTSMSDHVVDNVDDDAVVSGGSTSLTTLNGLSAQKVNAIETEEELERILDGHSVDEITKVIENIITDKSVKKSVRRQAVGRVVDNQPHPVKEFEKFKLWNGDMRSEWGVHDDIRMMAGTFSIALLLMLIIAPVAYFEAASIGFTLGVASAPLVVFGGIGYFAGGANYVYFLKNFKHKRHDMSLEGFREKEHQEKVDQARKKYEEQQAEMKLLGISEDGGSTVTVSEVREEFADAKARIASYELDIKKSLSLPAFNNVTVPQVNTMVKQLRKCARMVDSMTVSNASAVSDAVDELWVDIQAAEQAAQQFEMNKFTDEERKDLNTAKSLLSHAEDSGNTEAARLNFYEQLSRVVRRLNSRRSGMIAVETVKLLEEKARPELTALGADVNMMTTSKEETAV